MDTLELTAAILGTIVLGASYLANRADPSTVSKTKRQEIDAEYQGNLDLYLSKSGESVMPRTYPHEPDLLEERVKDLRSTNLEPFAVYLGISDSVNQLMAEPVSENLPPKEYKTWLDDRILGYE